MSSHKEWDSSKGKEGVRKKRKGKEGVGRGRKGKEGKGRGRKGKEAQLRLGQWAGWAGLNHCFPSCAVSRVPGDTT